MPIDPVELRNKRQADRVKAANAHATPRIRVLPRDDEMRRLLTHPSGNLAFPQEGGGSVEWPLDQFTKKRLRDGTITREEAVEASKPIPNALIGGDEPAV